MIIKEEFKNYLFQNLCRSGASWDLEISGKIKTFNEVKVTDERILFLMKKNGIRDIQSDLKIANISNLRSLGKEFTFEYKSPGREETKVVKIGNMRMGTNEKKNRINSI